MAKRGRSGRLLRVLVGTITIGWGSGLFFAPFVQSHTEEVGIFAETEAILWKGDLPHAAEVLQTEFLNSATAEERLERIGPLARVALAQGELTFLLEKLSGDGWERALLRAAVFQYLEDLPAALREATAIEGNGLPEEVHFQLLDQIRFWTEMAGAEPLLPLEREVFEAEPTEENHFRYIAALVESGEEKELLQHLSNRSDHLVSEADFWRHWFPDFQQLGWLGAAAAIFENAWKDGTAEALFALGEMHLFSGKTETAGEIFWRVFEEQEGPLGSGDAIRRLNGFFHNRYAAMNRIGQTDKRYGTEQSRHFLFFGLRDDVRVLSTAAARDAAIVYLRELELREGESREFLKRLRQALDRQARPASQRILAFAQAGATRWMLEEIENFVRSSDSDTDTAEFALLAINRLILSTEKFPELRQQMRDLALALGQKVEPSIPHLVAERQRELQERIQRRLGFELKSSGAEEARQDLFEQISTAKENGDLAEAERLYRELAKMTGSLPNLLLFLADGWLQAGQPEKAAALVFEVLGNFESIRADASVSVPLHWSGNERFLPNPGYSDDQQEMLYRTFQFIGQSEEVQTELQAIWQRNREQLLSQEKFGPVIVEILCWQHLGKQEETLAAARTASRFQNPEVQLFAALALAVEGAVEESETVLREILATDGGGSERARRLLFALHVFRGNPDGASEQAVWLEEQDLDAAEKVAVATGLLSVGKPDRAANWLEGVDPEALWGKDVDAWRLALLKTFRAQEDREKEEGLARAILLAELPHGFEMLGNALRIEALESLRLLGQLEEYQGELKRIVALASEAIPVYLLLGEVAEYQGDLDEAKEAFSVIAEIVPEGTELPVELAEWLAGHGFWEEAVAVYQAQLHTDVITVLLDLSALLRAYREAGELERLLTFLEDWQAPESVSLDRFYGLQPTAHIFEPLGEELQETGQHDLAIRAWKKGLEINPVAFTDGIRLKLAELYGEQERASEIVNLIRAYVTEQNPDPEIYWHQPFASPVPRWINLAVGNPENGPVGRMVSVLEELEATDELALAAVQWRREFPDRFSPAVFEVYLSFRSGQTDWPEKLEALEQRFPDENGPSVRAWDAARKLFAGDS